MSLLQWYHDDTQLYTTGANVSYFYSMPYVGMLLLIFSSFTLSMETNADSLQNVVQDRLFSHYREKFPNADINIDLNSINDYVNSRKCENYQFTVPDQLPSGGKLTLRVNCTSPNWVTYVSAKISIYLNVAAAKVPLSRGAQIDANDIKFIRYNITSLNQGYFTSPDQLIGLITRRNIANNSILNSNVLLVSNLINKGDAVTIEASIGSLTVKTNGIALEDGKKGQQIAVMNSRSQKEIKAYVKERGVVSTRE